MLRQIEERLNAAPNTPGSLAREMQVLMQLRQLQRLKVSDNN